MTEPTAGPWTIEEAEDGSAYTVQVSPHYQACILGGDGTALADVRSSDLRIKRSPEEARANARLMAAAPALLAVCEKINDWFSHEKSLHDATKLLIELQSTIRKARGD